MARILVVDPDVPIRALTRRILVMDHHDVTDVATGDEALASLAADPFDLIVIDVELPDVDGYDLLDTIRAAPNGRSAPIVVTSARVDGEAAIREARAGVLDHVRKPFGFGQLSSAVRRVLQTPPEELDELRVSREEAADMYRSVLDLTVDARNKR